MQGCDESYRKCMAMLLESAGVRAQLQRVVNKRDLLGYTPLHFASQLWAQHEVAQLLRVGVHSTILRHARFKIFFVRGG